MSHQNLVPKTINRAERHPAASVVDFCIDTGGDAADSLVMFLPSSKAGEAWAETDGFSPGAYWLGVYLTDRAAAAATIAEMLHDGLVVRLDGRTVRP